MVDTETTIPRDIERYTQFLKHGLPGVHAYVVLLGLDYFDLPNVLKAVEKGFPWKAFERLVENFGLPADQVAAMAGIPKRTLARRKVEKRFTSDESDRLLRVARVFGNSLTLFRERDVAVRFLTTIQRALGTEPARLIKTEVGAQEVERIIGALENGIFL